MKQFEVLAALRSIRAESDEYVSPTTLGMSFGLKYNGASAAASRILKKLLAQGFVERNSRGQWRATSKRGDA